MPRIVWKSKNPRSEQVIERACAHLKSRQKAEDGKKGKRAIIFDIDDTILVSRNCQVHRNEKVYSIYRYALEHDFHVFFITARRLNLTTKLWTLHQLYMLGYEKYHGLFLMPRDKLRFHTAAQFKASVRARIRKTHQIMLNVGDQWSDLFVFKIPGSAPHECSDTSAYYAISHEDGVGLALKLPNRYVVC